MSPPPILGLKIMKVHLQEIPLIRGFSTMPLKSHPNFTKLYSYVSVLYVPCFSQGVTNCNKSHCDPCSHCNNFFFMNVEASKSLQMIKYSIEV